MQQQREERRPGPAALITIVILAIVVGAISIAKWSPGILIACLLGSYAVLCFTMIGAEEKALKVRLGRPIKYVYTSGWTWRWWPIEWFYRFPTEEQRLDIDIQKVITRARDGYSAAVIEVNATFYFFWPKTGKALVNSYKKAPSPDRPGDLKGFFGDALADAVRRIGGQYSWYECAQGWKRYTINVHKALGKEQDPKGPVAQSGITEFRVVITEVILPDELKTAISKPQIADLEKEAAIKKAEGEKRAIILKGEGEKERLTREGEGQAAAREAIFSAIEKQDARGAFEAMLTLREMSQGTSNTILYTLPPQMVDSLATLLGGNRPEDILRRLTPEALEALIARLGQRR